MPADKPGSSGETIMQAGTYTLAIFTTVPLPPLYPAGKQRVSRGLTKGKQRVNMGYSRG
ncbi:hypothetical protein ACEN2P_17615 [Pedobacter psychrotolerans]|uniref:hypothetical protein n=1 Tax=Pedobacter psychrotolerans TaxID=1843235 RepID=UPI003F97951B